MAEVFLFDLIEKLIGKLGSMAVETLNVRDDLEKLVENMSEIKAVILDAEEQQLSTNSHQIQHWLEKLKDALDDVEDLLDDLATEHLKRCVMTKDKKAKKVSIFFSSSNQLLLSFRMAQKIKDHKKTIESLNVDRRIFNFTNRALEPPIVMKQRQTHSFIREDEVIGREREKKELIESLLNTDVNVKERVSVISITGFGGLGKTALAQLVYNDKAVQQHFELKMWICVAQDSNVNDFDAIGVAAKILESEGNIDMEKMQYELRKKVEGKRFLLVLDDMWNEEREYWLQLITLLVDGEKGSKIIVTTRSEKVSKIIGTSKPLFLKGLDEKQSWRLFSQLAFEDGKESDNHNLLSIGKEIVKKCVGVPLAIRSIGSLMFSMDNEKDWSNFKDKDLAKIDEQGGNKVFQLIKLSYDRLPFPLKKCFAFCSLFPKGNSIKKTTLIRLWIAEGFIQPSDEYACIEDIGDKYFMTLVHGSFFQDIRRDMFGDIYSFKMHDIVHDLACVISGKYYSMVKEKGQHIDRQTRHVSFSFALDSSWQVPNSLLQASKLRTFMSSQSQDWSSLYEKQSPEEFICDLIMSSFKQIWVLKLNRITSTNIPSCIGNLKHLRYLDLSYSKQIEMLPRSITKLNNLETLLLNWCSKLKELPKDIWKLISLRHLELNDCHQLTCMPRGIGQLTKLQTLTKFELDTTSKHSAGASELKELNDLRGELEIRGLQHLRHSPTQAKEMNLMGKLHLQSLILNWGYETPSDTSDIEKDEIILQNLPLQPNIKALHIIGFSSVSMKFSMSNISFTNLNKLSLYSCTRLQYLPQLHVKSLFLSHLPLLEWIVNDNNNGNSMTLSTSVVEIYLSGLPKLKGWCKCSKEEVKRGCHHQFKSLDCMCISDCPNLVSIPRHTCIKRIELLNVNEKILQQAVNHSKVESLDILRMDDLKSLSGVLQHLTTLVELRIGDCKELNLCDGEDGCYNMQWKELKNLRRLKFDNIPKMESLPKGLQHVTTLETLTILNCGNLTFVPEWVISLQALTIKNCFNLASLPDGMEVYKTDSRIISTWRVSTAEHSDYSLAGLEAPRRVGQLSQGFKAAPYPRRGSNPRPLVKGG